MKRLLTFALSVGFFIWLPNAFADGGGLLLDAPSHIRQTQNNHKALLTLRVDNIQVRAEWRVTSAVEVFDIYEGELRTVTTVAPGKYVATIYVEDKFDLLNDSYANLTASAVITVEFKSGAAEELRLDDVPRLTAVAGEAGILHTLVATGGSEDKTYTLVGGDDADYFGLDKNSGVLSLLVAAQAGVYTLTVQAIDDGRNVTVDALATVEVSAALMLADAPLLSVALGSTVGLHTFIASGGIGRKTYTLAAGDKDYFSVDAGSGVLSLLAAAQKGVHTLTVQAIDGRNVKVNALATVEVLSALKFAAVPSFTVIANVGMNLHTLVANGGIGTPTYTILAGNKDGHFALDAASGVLSLSANAKPDNYVLRIQAMDVRANTAQAMVTVGVSAVLSLSDAPSRGGAAGTAMSLHTFAAEGGIGARTYTLLTDDVDNYFSLGAKSGVLSLLATAAVGIYTLSVEVKDSRGNVANALATVGVLSLYLADARPLYAVVGREVSLHTFEAQGDSGAGTYTLVVGDERYFTLGKNNGVLSVLAAPIGIYTLSVKVEAMGNRADATAIVEVRASLSLVAMPPLTIIVGRVAHTLTASGGIGIYTYAIVPSDEDGHFALDAASGVLSLRADAALGSHTLTVQVKDERDNTAQATVMVEASAVLSLAAVPSFTVIASVGMNLHTLVASGGIGAPTYTIVSDNEDGHFALNATSGVLSLSVNAKTGEYTLTVQVMDERGNTVQAVATVEVSAVLTLAAVSPLTIIVGEVAHTLVASGGIGAKTYTITGGDEGGHFALDVISGVLSLSVGAPAKMYTLTVRATDERSNIAEVVATVDVSAVLEFTSAPPFTVIASVAMSLHTFIASGGIGIKTYTLVAGDDEKYFAVDAASGVFSLSLNTPVREYTLTVQAMDARDNTVETVVTVEVSAALALAAAPSFTVIASVGMNLHTFVASGGIGTPTYTIVAGNEDKDFTLNATSGVLSLLVDAEAGSHRLTVQVMDERDNTADTVVTVGVSAVLSLAATPSFTVIASAAMSLHTFIASGGIGIKTYTLVAGDAEEYFAVDAASGVFSLSLNTPVREYTLTVQVMDERDNAADTVVTVEVSAALKFAEVPPFTVIASIAMSLHTFVASDGIGVKTYTLLDGDGVEYFSVDAASGVLSLSVNTPAGEYMLIVQAEDEHANTVQAVVTVGLSAVLSLADAQRLGGAQRTAISLHTFAAQGGIGSRTYTLLTDDAKGYFSLDAESGGLSLLVSATMGTYTLSVQVKDDRGNVADAMATVDVAFLLLSDAPPLYAVVGREVSLHTFATKGVYVTLTYTITAGDDKDYFSLDTASGVLSVRSTAAIGVYTLSVSVKDSPSNAEALALAVVEVRASLSLATVPPLTVIVGSVAHTLAGSGGIGTLTYAIAPGNEDGFAVDAASGVLSLSVNAKTGRHTLTLQVADARANTVQALATVEVSAALTLAEVPSFTVIASVAMSLHTFIASGGIGIKTYTLVAGDAEEYFAVDATSGVFSLSLNTPAKDYMLTVRAMDARDNTVETVVTVEVSAALALAAAPSFTVIASVGMNLHTLVASGGIGTPTYTILAGNEGRDFTLNATSGVLSLSVNAKTGEYTLTVQVMDARDNTADTVVTVEVSAALALAEVPSFTVIASVAMSLHTFIASGGIGIKTYTLVAGDAEEYFAVDAASGVFSLSLNTPVREYTLTVRAMDERDNTVETVVSVEVSAVLSLAAAPSFTVIASVGMNLHTFVASGGIGTPTYTIVAGNEGKDFTLNAASGMLSLSVNAEAGSHTLTVQVMDERDNAADTVVTVEVSAALVLADAPSFTVIASVAMSLHTFIASGGIGTPTYTILAGNEGRDFTLNAASGVLSLSVNAKTGEYTLTVQVMDERDNTADTVVTVGVSAVLSLAATPSFTVIASVGMNLHTFVASGGIGTPTYTILAGNEGRDFTLNAASGVLSLSVNAEVGSHTLTVQVMDERDNTADTVVTVEVSAALALAATPSFTVIASAAMNLHTFVASGGIGTPTYTILAGNEGRDFTLNATSGVLSLSVNAEVGSHRLTVQVMDERDNTADTVVTVEVSAALTLAAAPSFTVIASAAMSLHTFIASGGIGIKAYTLVAGDAEEYFAVDATSGVFSLSLNTPAKDYMLTVRAMDERDNTAETVVTVGVSAALVLAATPSFTVIASVGMSLHTFIASGGIGIKTYTLVAGDAEEYFAVDAASGVFSLSLNTPVREYTLTVQVMDERDNTADTVVTVGVSAVLSLAEVPSFTVIASVGMSLHTFIASGGIGTPTYTILAGNEGRDFTLNATSGVLSLSVSTPAGEYMLIVQAEDEHANTVQAVVTVGLSAVLSLADAPRLGGAERTAISLHTFAAQGGIGSRTYTLLTGDVEDYFSLDAESGVLSLLVSATMGTYTLSVQVKDDRGNVADALATVNVAFLFLSDAPPLYAVVGREVSLHTFAAKGVYVALTYTITAGDDKDYFSLATASGVLSVRSTAVIGVYTLSVSVKDSPSNAEALALAVVEVRASLSLVAVPSLTVIAGSVAHTLAGSGGIGTHTYAIVSGDEGGFAVDAASGVLSLSVNAEAGRHTLTVQVMDERDNTAQAVVTVGVSAVLSLAAAPSFTVIASAAMSLHTFIASGGIGIKAYTLVAGDAEEYFAVDAASGVFSLSLNTPAKEYTLTVRAMDARDNTVETVVTVGVSAALELAATPSFTVIASVGMNLHTFVASGGIGTPTYTIVAGNEGRDFTLNAASGVLSLSVNAEAGSHRLTVQVMDERDNTAETVVTVGVSAALVLADAPSFTVIASVGMSLHMFIASGGIGTPTYTIVAGNEGKDFTLNATSGVLSLSVNAKTGEYTLTVQVMDERDNAADTVVTVEVSAVLSLAAAPSFTVIASVGMNLHTFVASGGIGTPTYTILAGNEGRDFTLNAASGVLSLSVNAEAGSHRLTVQVMDERDNTVETVVTVGVSAALELAATPSFTVIASVGMNLHTFVASGGIGIKIYTLVAGDAEEYFAVDATSGVFSLSLNTPAKDYMLTVRAMDARDNTADTVVTVGVSAVLSLAEVPSFTVIASVGMSLHTFIASGGIGTPTYTILAGNEGRDFTLNAASGVLSLSVNAEVGRHTLTVRAMDARDNTAETVATVGVSAALALADAPSFTVIISAALSLHTFTASGGIGTPTYTIVAGNEGKDFTLNATSGVLSLLVDAEAREYTLTVRVMDEHHNSIAALATVRVSAVLALADALLLRAIVRKGKNLHTFAATGGIGDKTYTIAAGNDYFSLDPSSGVLSVNVSATVAMYTLSVQVADAKGNVATALATVEVVPSLLQDVMLYAIVGQKVSLHTFEADGGNREKVFTIVAGNKAQYFTIDATSGVLSVQGGATVGIYTLSVAVDDDGGDREGEVMAVVAVEASLFLADAPSFTVIAVAMSVHTFAASGGIGAKTYTITVAGDGADSFSLNAASGVLSVANATAGVYTLSVKVSDSRGNQAQARGTVEVVEVLSLADVSLDALARLSVEVTLTTFAASGGYGAKRYTMIADESGYFAFDADRGELSLPQDPAMLAGEYTLFVGVSDSLMPPQQVTATVVVRIGKNGIFVMGGRGDGNSFPSDVWFSLDGKSWSKQSDTSAWPGRYEHQVASRQGRLYLMGGSGTGTDRTGVWSSADGSSWSSEGNKSWLPRIRFQMVEYKGRLYAMGGNVSDNAEGRSNDVWSSEDGKIWTQVTMTAAWSARQAHQVVVHNDRMYLLGGNAGSLKNDVWSSTDGRIWSFEGDANWPGRHVHQAVSHQGRLYVLGGRVSGHSSYSSDVWSWAVGEENWTRETSDGWLARDNFQAVSYDGLLYVMGGNIETEEYYNDVWSSADGKKWTSVTVGAGWSARGALQAEVFPPPLVMWGVGASEAIILTVGVSAAEFYTVTAQYGVGPYTYSLTPKIIGININDDGVLLLDDQAQAGTYAVTVRVEDKERSHAEIINNIEIRSLALADAPPLSVIAGEESVSLHVFTAIYGVGKSTYNLVDDLGYFTLGTKSEVLPVAAKVNLGYFTLGAESGVLSLTANVSVGVYTLSVVVRDESDNQNQATAVATVEAVPLSLADAPPLEALARSSAAVSLHTFVARDGVGSKRYTMIADESGYFSLDAGSGELSLPSNSAMLAGAYTLRVEVSDSLSSPQRATAAATVRIAKNGIFVMGGRGYDNSFPSDVWFSLDGKNWSKQSDTSAWPGRYEHQVASHQGRLYLMGGYGPGTPRTGVWSSADGSSWSSEGAQDWLPRWQFQVVEYKDRLYAMGGNVRSGAKDRKNDVWSSADGESWMLVTMNAAWEERRGHQVVVHNDRMYLLGGNDGAYYDDVWSSTDGRIWSFEGNANWPGRYVHQAVSHQGRLYVLGGRTPDASSDVWSWAVGEENLTRETEEGWPARDNFQAVSYDGLLYVMGGNIDTEYYNDVWSSADGKKWTIVTDGAGWAAREVHQAVVFPPPLVMWGVGAGEAIILTLGVSAAEFYAVKAQYGLGPYTYSLTPKNIGIDINGDGVLSMDNAQVGAYVVTVRVEDKERSHAEIIINNIEIRSFVLADAPPLSVIAGAAAVSLHVFTAIYGVGESTYDLVDDSGYFTLGTKSGVLSMTANVAEGVYTISVGVSDENNNQVTAVATVVAVPLSLADAPPLEALARLSVAVPLHTFVVGGIGSKRYTMIADESGYFALDAASGELSLPSNSAMLTGVYTLRVEVEVPGSRSPLRAAAAATVRIAKNGIFVMSGNDGGFPRDVWLSLDGKNWSKQIDEAAWPETYEHQVASHQGRLYLLAGGINQGVWSSADGSSWSFVGNQDWSRRYQFQVVEYKDRLYAMGGNDDVRKNDVWSSADGESWTEVTMTAAWSARQGHQVVVYNDRMYLLGGYGLVGVNEGSLNDVWSSADGRIWSFEGNANWPKRFAHQAVSHQGRLYVLGGMGAGSDVWSWAVGEENWTQETTNGWLARNNFQAVSYDGLLYVMGGKSVISTYYNDVWTSADGKEWTRAPVRAAWSARQQYQAEVFPPPLVMWGVGASEAIILTVGVSAAEIYAVKAQYGLGPYTYSLTPKNMGIDINGDGVLSMDNAQAGAYVVTVRVEDKERSHAEIIINIEIGSFVLADAPPLFVVAGLAEGVSLHAFTAIYGIGASTYELVGDESGYFTLGTVSGVLSMTANVYEGGYTLSVVVSDENGKTATAVATVAAVPMLSLADAPSLEALARLSVEVSLHTFVASGGAGSKRYTIIAGNKAGYFALDADSGELSLPSNSAMLAGDYTLRVEVSDRLPSPQRTTAAATVRITKNRIFVLGGRVSESDYNSEVWWWSAAGGDAWKRETANASWPARFNHQAVAYHGRLYVMGGWDGGSGGYTNDVWSSADAKAWKRETANVGWAIRYGHQAVAYQGRLYVLGGFGAGAGRDVWSWADGEESWRQDAAEAWPEREFHQAVVHNGRLYVLGGSANFHTYYKDVWSSADGANWSFEGNAEWPVRSAHQAVSHQGRLYILGGKGSEYNYNDVWSSLDGKSWRQETAAAAWPKRNGHQVVSRDGRLYLMGGEGFEYNYNDVWSSVDGKSWGRENPANANWWARRSFQAVVFPPSLVLSGSSEVIILISGVAVAELHTVTAQYGVGQYTYSLALESESIGFGIDKSSGVLSADGNAAVGDYTLTVQVEDEEGSQAETVVQVEIVAASTAASIISPPALGGGASALALAGGGLSLLIITPPASSLARPRTPPTSAGGENIGAERRMMDVVKNTM